MSILSRSVSGLKPVPSATSRSVQTPPASETATLRDDDPNTSSGHELADTSENDSEDTSEAPSLSAIVNEVKQNPYSLYLSLFAPIEAVQGDEPELSADQIAQAYKKI